MIITQPKDTAPIPLKKWEYVKVATSTCPAGGEQHIMGYTNLNLKLSPGRETGKIRIKAVRRGTSDGTAYDDRTVHVDDEEGNCNWLVTQVWFGGRPPSGIFDWYVKLMRGVDSGEANAGDEDYGKAMNN